MSHPLRLLTLLFFLVGAIAPLFLIFPGHVQAGSEPAEKVRLQLAWTHQFEFAGFYAARARGFYAREGLDVEIAPGGPGITPLDQVLDGKAEYGVAGSEILLGYMGGRPLAVLAPIFQHSAACLVARRDAGIRSPQDLSGKRVEMGDLETDAETYAMLGAEGVFAEDLDRVDSTFQPDNLIAGRVAAISAYSTNQPFFLHRAGVPFQVIRPITYGVDFYGDSLFTSRQELTSHPDRAERFLKASLEGWAYALEHPEEIIDLILSEYSGFPYAHSRAHLAFEAREIRRLILPNVVEIGHSNPGRWNHMAETFHRIGLASDVPVLDDFFAFTPKKRFGWDHWLVKVAGLVLVVTLSGMIAIFFFNLRLRREIRDRKKAEEELRQAKIRADAANEAKSFFLANMSHEIRTPLNGILGLTRYTLDSTSLTGSQREDLQLVEESARHLLTIINDILDLSKIQSDGFTLQQRSFSLHRLIDSVDRFFRLQFDSAGVMFRVDMAPETPDSVTGDDNRIRQILTNLLGNAFKFTEQGSVELTVAPLSGTDRIEFLVSDTGPGISRENLDRLFAPFTQVDISLTRKQEGTGLGLAICKQLAERMGGTITAHSEPGSGSQFRVTLPLPLSQGRSSLKSADSSEQEPGERAAEKLHDLSVLLAEDNKVNRVYMHHILNRAGCRVQSVENGADAVAYLRKKSASVDLVLMDLQMPIMDGMEAARIVREELALDIPIIALSAHAESGYEARCLGAGMNGFITKPVDAETLLETISDLDP